MGPTDYKTSKRGSLKMTQVVREVGKKPHNIAVIIGRFQPFHDGHLELFQKATEIADHVVVLLGSSNQPATVKNPWDWKTRAKTIRASVRGRCFSTIQTLSNLHFRPLNDHWYNDPGWIAEVQEHVQDFAHDMFEDEDSINVALVGHHKAKDASTYYLDMFPQWDYVETDKTYTVATDEGDDVELEATSLRKQLFEGGIFPFANISDQTNRFLEEYSSTPEYDALKAEYDYYKEYPNQYGKGPFVTTDACLVCCGHVLLIRRGRLPGKGLYALPGGFLDNDERIATGIIRELREETKIKIPVPVLHGSMKQIEVFDAPSRSLRGRLITHCGLINLRNDVTLPEVRGADDADKALWVPLAEFFSKYRTIMFEDHYDIVSRMVSLVK
jgi:bifunctional NMN adenylyltransferase/nudix hydrolase